MSNLHVWKTKGKHFAKEYCKCMQQRDMNYGRMLEIQNFIGIKRC